jgi:hypothetical protein
LLTGMTGPKDAHPRAVKLAGARITGALDLEAATLKCPLNLRGCSFEQPINLQEAQASVLRLSGCDVPGLSARQLQTRGNLELNNGFSAKGEVNLLGAHIGGTLDLSGATLSNPNGRTLFAASLMVDRSMYCRNGFSAEGEMNLLGAHIGSNLEFDGASLNNREGMALDLEGLRARALILRPQAPPEGTVDLTNAQVDVCYDSEGAWPDDLRLDGFTYGALVARPVVDVTTRLRWLKRDPGGYTPQLYEQLAAAYRKAGQDDAARKVAIAKQRRRRETLNSPGKMWNDLLRWTVGYGYETWKAGVYLLGLVGLGWCIFYFAHSPYPAHLLPAKPPGERPWFDPGFYALDLLLPFADLGYQSAWIAGGWARWFFLLWNLAGWVLITAVLAALSGLMNRD